MPGHIARRKLRPVAVALSLALAVAHAQQSSIAPSEPLPAYDAVVIKPNNTGSGSVSINSTLTHYAATNVSFKNLLEDAYDIKQELISGIPGPIDSARFDVEAKISEPDPVALKKLTGPQRRSMLLPVLADRFQLKAHTETRILPVYDLVVVKDSPKFKPSVADQKHGHHTNIRSDNTSVKNLTAEGVSMTEFASSLTNQLHRTVIDKTNLPGTYDLTMKWTPDDAASTGQTDLAPSLFTALQEQLGLKLQPAKGPVETLIVDHVEMPSEN